MYHDIIHILHITSREGGGPDDDTMPPKVVLTRQLRSLQRLNSWLMMQCSTGAIVSAILL